MKELDWRPCLRHAREKVRRFLDQHIKPSIAVHTHEGVVKKFSEHGFQSSVIELVDHSINQTLLFQLH